jgi:demethoxyubiquinone hydroxylase (CLK1/Coq7/Cat5 family)
LNAAIQKLGGEPVTMTPDFKGTVLKTMTQVTSVLGTEAALVAMIGNEELTNRSYDAALAMDWQDAEIRELLERNRADERRHIEWIKRAALDRPWAHRDSEAHP